MRTSFTPLQLTPDLPSLLRLMYDHYFKFMNHNERNSIEQHAQPLIIFTTGAGMAACLQLFFWDLIDNAPTLRGRIVSEVDKEILRSRIRCLHSRTQQEKWNRDFCENPNDVADKVFT